ncbi:MAG: ABC transporter permease [Alistipes sp.]|nr:ABC transporter permease [Alistipes sp.]
MLINSIISSLKRELREIISDKLYIAILLLLPTLMILFFGIIFYRGAIEGVPIAVVDRDFTPLSRQMLGMINATSGVDIAFEEMSIYDAEERMLNGEVMGIVYVDQGFEDSIYRGESAEVGCYLNGANISASGVASRDIQLAVQSFSAGIELQRLQSMGVDNAQAMVEIMPINIQSNIISNPYLNYGYYLAPIFMILGIVVFTVLSTIYAVGRELRYRTAQSWLSVANNSLAGGVVGKLLPTTMSMTLMSQIIYLVLFVVMGMECEGSYIVLTLVTILFIIVYQTVALSIISVTSNLRLALSLGGGYSVMAFTFSGITFPTMAMYGVAQAFSKLFPLSYFSEFFVGYVMRDAPLRYDVDNLLYMTLFLVVVPLSWRRLQTVVSEDKYWGRE